MKRVYETGQAENVNFFTGIEVEHTPAYGKKTLFVSGAHDYKTIHAIAMDKEVSHVYLGANQSFVPSIKWDVMINGVLENKWLTTLDFDVKYIDWVVEGGYCDYDNLFIPQISVKIPNIRLLNYNTMLKIDDKDFNASNPGVWCHRLHNLQDISKFTAWSQYGKDQPI